MQNLLRARTPPIAHKQGTRARSRGSSYRGRRERQVIRVPAGDVVVDGSDFHVDGFFDLELGLRLHQVKLRVLGEDRR